MIHETHETVVIVPLDGSAESLSVLPVARAFAALSEGVVHLVHVANDALRTRDTLARIGLSPDELEGSVLEPRSGPPARGILHAAAEHEAEFIVLSTHTAASHREGEIGATALEVIREASCPVILLRPERAPVTWELRTILVGHDGSPVTSAAIRPAAELANRADAHLRILHAAAPGALPAANAGAISAPRYLDQPQYEWPAWTTEFVRRFLTESHSDLPHVHLALAHGVPGLEILRHAQEEQVDLVVLTWKGDFAEEHAPTIRSVLRDAPCPVMIVRTEPSAMAEPLRRHRSRRARPGVHPR